MTAILALAAWFGSGAAGAWAAMRHYGRLLPGAPASDLSAPAAISVLMGPAGLFAAILYAAMFPIVCDPSGGIGR